MRKAESIVIIGLGGSSFQDCICRTFESKEDTDSLFASSLCRDLDQHGLASRALSLVPRKNIRDALNTLHEGTPQIHTILMDQEATPENLLNTQDVIARHIRRDGPVFYLFVETVSWAPNLMSESFPIRRDHGYDLSQDVHLMAIDPGFALRILEQTSKGLVARYQTPDAASAAGHISPPLSQESP